MRASPAPSPPKAVAPILRNTQPRSQGRILTAGTDTRDSGIVDRAAWIDYLGARSPLTPDFARQAVAATNLPVNVLPNSRVRFGLSGLDLTSLGSPQNGVEHLPRCGGCVSLARIACEISSMPICIVSSDAN